MVCSYLELNEQLGLCLGWKQIDINTSTFRSAEVSAKKGSNKTETNWQKMHEIKQIPQHVKWQIQAQFFIKHLWGADNWKCLHHDGLWVGFLFVCFYVKVNCREDESLRCNRFFLHYLFFFLPFLGGVGGGGVDSNTKLAIENTKQPQKNKFTLYNKPHPKSTNQSGNRFTTKLINTRYQYTKQL